MTITSIAYSPVLTLAIKKAYKRLMPLMFILYFIAFIDRVNVGFAKDAMSTDINLSESAYALGAGIFFLAYALFGMPSNVIMHKLGAKIWLSLTTVLWGILSACTGLVSNANEFIILRFLTGLCEAGFYPGILLVATIWFPNKIRSSVISIFVLGVPVALTLGSPLSGALLELHGFLGKPGWFWMFVIEGLPAVLLGIFAYFYLDNSPSQARFLTSTEREALTTQLASEQLHSQTSSIKIALKDIRVWHLAFIYGAIQISVYGLLFFLPAQVATLMGTSVNFTSSLITAIPWAISLIGVYFIPRYADHYPAQRVAISFTCLLAAAVTLLIASYANPVMAIVCLSICAVGLLAVQPIFWTFPPQLLSGPALAAGIGFCTAIGAFCGFLAPIIRVQANEVFNNQHAGVITLTILTLICALLIALLKNNTIHFYNTSQE